MGAVISKRTDQILGRQRMLVLGGVVAWLLSVAWCVLASFANGSITGTGINASFLFAPFIVLGWYVLCTGGVERKMPAKMTAAIENLGSSTLGIYLIHRPFAAVFNGLLSPGSFFARLLVTVLVLGVSWAATRLLMRIPRVRYLVTL